MENQAECFKFWKKIQGLPQTLSQIQWGGGVEKSGRVFEILEKKIQGLPRALSHIQLGRGGKSGRVFEILEKKFKGSRGHLAKFSWGGGKSGRVFEILEKKNSRAPAGT